MVSSQGDL